MRCTRGTACGFFCKNSAEWRDGWRHTRMGRRGPTDAKWLLINPPPVGKDGEFRSVEHLNTWRAEFAWHLCGTLTRTQRSSSASQCFSASDIPTALVKQLASSVCEGGRRHIPGLLNPVHPCGLWRPSNEINVASPSSLISSRRTLIKLA